MSDSRKKLEEELSAFQASETGFIADNNNPAFFEEWVQLSLFIQSVCKKSSEIDLEGNLMGTLIRIKKHVSELADAMDQVTGKLTPEEQRKMKEDYLKTAQAKLISLVKESPHPERNIILTEIMNTLFENELQDPLKRKDIGVIKDEVIAYREEQKNKIFLQNFKKGLESYRDMRAKEHASLSSLFSKPNNRWFSKTDKLSAVKKLLDRLEKPTESHPDLSDKEYRALHDGRLFTQVICHYESNAVIQRYLSHKYHPETVAALPRPPMS